MKAIKTTLCALLGIGALLHSESALAEITMLAPGDDIEGAINAAQPGDELVLSGGTYELTDRFGISVHGTQALPIVVRAAEGETPVLQRASADQNAIDVDDAEYLVLRGLEISGGSYEGLKILRNELHHTNGTGEGMYLGCNENACQMFDSLIEGNHVHHTNAPTVEQGDGIEIKEGSYNNIVRDNVIHDTNYPCIITYSTAGNGAPNVIERNVMWSCGDHGIQSAADAIIRNNIILGSVSNGIAMQPHQNGVPLNLVVVHNTVLHATNDAISASDIAGPVVIANNAVYAEAGSAIRVSGDLVHLALVGNVGVGGVEPASAGSIIAGSLADDFVSASFSGTVPNDVFPKVGSALIAAGAIDRVTLDDFNGSARNGVADVGAYAFDEEGNPGWPLAAEPKGEVATSGEPDAGAPVGGQSAGEGGAGEGGAGGAAGNSAGVGGTDSSSEDAGGGRDGGPRSYDGGVNGGTPGSSDDSSSGCSCRIASASRGASTRAGLGVLLAALAIAIRLRSRRARRR